VFDELAIRAAIVAEAISWEGTPYHSHARIKGAGVDCAQLPAAVYSAAGCMPIVHPVYSEQWMMHRDDEIYLSEIRRFAREIAIEAIQPGDLVVWKFGRTYSHSAIVIDPPLVIHAVLKGRAVIRADIDGDEDLRSRPRMAFSVFNEAGDGFVHSADELAPPSDAEDMVVPLSRSIEAGSMARGDYDLPAEDL
jgi:cell wall-associated NlpC family hydrolase